MKNLAETSLSFYGQSDIHNIAGAINNITYDGLWWWACIRRINI